MTTPDRPIGGSAGPGSPDLPEEGVVRVFPGPPPAEPQPVAPVPPVGGYTEPPTRPTPFPATPPPAGPPSTGDAAKSAAGDVKDQAASSAADVKDTAASQAAAVKNTAQQQAGQVKDTAVGAASDVAATAREQAQNVVGEASQQARQLADSLTSQLNEQAGAQQQRAAGSLRQLADGVSDMAEGRGAPSGPLADYTRQAADRLQTAAGYLEDRQPGELLDDARSFAARRPTAFLVGAAIAGFAVGRLVKGAKGGSSAPGGTTGSSRSAGTGSSGTAGSSFTAGSSVPDVPSTGTGFGAPTVFPDAPTPAPGYSDRIPADPYPTDGIDVREPVRPSVSVDPLADPLIQDGLHPGTSGGGRGV